MSEKSMKTQNMQWRILTMGCTRGKTFTCNPLPLILKLPSKPRDWFANKNTLFKVYHDQKEVGYESGRLKLS